jgi:hypothetical protein
MGNQKWRRLLESHDQLARQTVEGHRGNLIKNTADGILATLRWTRSRRTLCAGIFGLSQTDWPALRSRLHTGEIEVRGRDIDCRLADREDRSRNHRRQ